jgi:hypothetical protein
VSPAVVKSVGYIVFSSTLGAVASGCHGGQPDERIIAHRSDGFQCHVAGALHCPFIILFQQDGADETNDRLLVGDPDDIGASLR